MSDTKRYRVCETCKRHGAMPHPAGGGDACPDCGHGDCAPGVVDAGCDLCNMWPCECPEEAPDGYGPGEEMLGR